MENTDNIYKKLNMLNKIYEFRQEDFEAENKKDRKELSKILHEIDIEDIEDEIKEMLNKEGKNEEAKEIIEKIQLLAENYEIQIAYYSQKNYKRGFKDAICLYTQCLQDNDTDI